MLSKLAAASLGTLGLLLVVDACSTSSHGTGSEPMKMSTPLRFDAASLAAPADAGAIRFEPSAVMVAPTGPYRVLTPEDVSADAIPGFVFSLSNTHLQIGDSQKVELVENGAMRRTSGTRGAALEVSNGFYRAVALDDADSVGPFTSDMSTHHARVLEYFKSAGLPADQILGTDIVSLTKESGLMADVARGLPPTNDFVGYTTVVTRRVAGVPVAESSANARFNARNEVVSERVWWPPLPKRLVAEVAAFQAMLSDDATAAAYYAKLPPAFDARSGDLTIRHSTYMGRVWYATVTLERRIGPNTIASYNVAGSRVYFDLDTAADFQSEDKRAAAQPTGTGPGSGNGTGGGNGNRRGDGSGRASSSTQP